MGIGEHGEPQGMQDRWNGPRRALYDLYVGDSIILSLHFPPPIDLYITPYEYSPMYLLLITDIQLLSS